MPQSKKAPANSKVEVILPDVTPKKGVVRFETEDRPVALTNIYLGREYYKQLGSPSAVKVTVEAHNADE